MKDSFRQSMSWLHTWTGLVVGWVLFFVFVTGTLGYVRYEIDQWMRPEQPLVIELPDAVALLLKAEGWLRTEAAQAAQWRVEFPGARGKTGLSVGWRERAPVGEKARRLKWQTLEPDSGRPSTLRVRETGGGSVLYQMHFFLHYMPQLWGKYIVGVCAMSMLVAMLTGIVAHRRFFKDFFTFRPAKGQRS